jgi:membrane associated rhomboid family serine protease
MRQPRPGLRFGRRLTPAVTWLIAINVATFLLFAFSGEAVQAALARWLVLTPGALLELELWKLVTTTVFTVSPFAFFLDLVVLWLFMPFLENEWGTRRFLKFAAVTSVVGNLVAALVGLLLGGAHAAVAIAGMAPFVYAALVGYGVQFGDRPISLFGVVPMKGRTLAIGISIVVVLAGLLNGRWVEGAGHVAAMATALILTLQTTGRFSPRLWLLQRRHARLRRRLSVLDGGLRSGGDRPGTDPAGPSGPKKNQWLN